MEYSFSIYQRMRIAGLLGETDLAYPISQFFAEIPKHLEAKGYYDWVSARIKK